MSTRLGGAFGCCFGFTQLQLFAIRFRLPPARAADTSASQSPPARLRGVLEQVDEALSNGNDEAALSLVRGLQWVDGGLRGFGAARQVPQRLYELDELKLNGIDTSAFLSPVDLTLGTIERNLQIAAVLGGLSISAALELSQLQILFLVLGLLSLWSVDFVYFGGGLRNLVLDTVGHYLSQKYHNRVIQHEAGHFLIAYLIGVLPKGYTITSLDTLIKQGLLNIQAGTAFVDYEFLEEINTGRLSATMLKKFSCIALAGVATEYLIYGVAEGGLADINKLDGLLKSLGFTQKKADSQVRWAVLNTVLMLRRHAKARSQLAEAMSSGCCLHLRDPCGTGDGRTSVGAAGRMDAGVAGRTDATAQALASSPNAASATRMDPQYTEIGSSTQPNPTNKSDLAISAPDPRTSQPSHGTVSLCDTYLVNPFPMFEHVGVNEEVLYGEQNLDEEDDEGEEDGEDDGIEGTEEEINGSSEAEDANVNDDEDWVAKEVEQYDIPKVSYDKDDPPMSEGSIYSSIEEFRIALSQHAIKHEFEYNTEKTDPERLRAYCTAKEKGCQWRIHASTLEDRKTIQVKVNPFEHTCASRQRSKKVKNATKAWICDKVMDWVRDKPDIGAKELQNRLLQTHFVEINYKRVHAGYQLALDKVYGDWKNSFDGLYSWKAEVEKRSPGSVIIIEHHLVREKHHFKRMFVAFKASVDGFHKGCRPYLSIDSTFLTGRFRGQLATACAVDGHNWLFPVVFAIMECEDSDNWEWFMEKLHDCIGDPLGLAICTDAGKGLSAVKTVFRNAEHRECMRHLVTNFKKKFRGKVFDENLWPAAYAWQPEQFDEHMSKMIEANPDVHTYLTENHPNLWMRCKFSELTKVDYVTNNLAESFNSWIRKFKAMHVSDLADRMRQKLMVKYDQRRRIGRSMSGLILPHIYNDLKMRSHGLKYRIQRSDDDIAEVYGKHWTFAKDQLVDFKHVVDLKHMTCTCRSWQISGKPCPHAIAFITYLREENLQLYVDKSYTIEKFRSAYEGRIPALTDKKQWPKPDKGFFLYPPLLRRPAGRPVTHRYKAAHEGGYKKKRRGSAHKCPICHKHGHHWNTCRDGDPEAKEALALLAAQSKTEKKRKKQEEASTEGGSKRDNTNLPKRPRKAVVPKNIQKNGKAKGTVQATATQAAPDSPAMGTRSRTRARDSPALGTRSKRKGEYIAATGTRTKKRLSDLL